ncbi:hypothetical protein K6025_04440 [Ehrlichia sp. JZT12]
MLGVNNLINSTTEIILCYLTKYKHDSKTKSILQSLLDAVNEIKVNLPKYSEIEAAEQVIKCEISQQIEKTIKECLLTIFDIDIQDRKKYMSHDKIVEYKGYVSSLLNRIVKCKSHIVYEGTVMPKPKSNDDLKRESCKHSKLSDIWERNKLLSEEEFENACFYFDLDAHDLKEVINLYSDKLVLAIIDMAFVQFLVEKRYFPPERAELNEKIESSYTKLTNHIILHKHFQSMLQCYGDRQLESLRSAGNRSVGQDLKGLQAYDFVDTKVRYLSSGKKNTGKKLITWLEITVFVTDFLFNICGLLFVAMHIYNVPNLISLKNLSISVCSVNVILVTMAMALVYIPKRSSEEYMNSVINDLTVKSFETNTESVNL